MTDEIQRLIVTLRNRSFHPSELNIVISEAISALEQTTAEIASLKAQLAATIHELQASVIRCSVDPVYISRADFNRILIMLGWVKE